MQMFKDVVAVIGITLIIVNFILSFYGIIMNNDRKQKLSIEEIELDKIEDTKILLSSYNAG